MASILSKPVGPGARSVARTAAAVATLSRDRQNDRHGSSSRRPAGPPRRPHRRRRGRRRVLRPRRPIRAIPTSRWSSGPPATADRAWTPPSTTRTSRRPPRRSWSTARPRASPVRCTSARTPMRCPSRPGPPPSRCCWPTASPLREGDEDYTPTPAVSRAIVVHNATADGQHGGRHRRHAVAQPAPRRRLQVQPAARRSGRLRRDQRDRRPGQRVDGRPGGDPPQAVRLGQRRLQPLRLPGRVLRGPGQRAQPARGPGGRRAHRRRPDGWGQRAVLGLHRRAPGHRPDRGQPARSTRAGRS